MFVLSSEEVAVVAVENFDHKTCQFYRLCPTMNALHSQPNGHDA